MHWKKSLVLRAQCYHLVVTFIEFNTPVVVIAGYLINYALICVTSLTVSSWFVNEAAAYVGCMVFYDNVIW